MCIFFIWEIIPGNRSGGLGEGNGEKRKTNTEVHSGVYPLLLANRAQSQYLLRSHDAEDMKEDLSTGSDFYQLNVASWVVTFLTLSGCASIAKDFDKPPGQKARWGPVRFHLVATAMAGVSRAQSCPVYHYYRTNMVKLLFPQFTNIILMYYTTKMDFLRNEYSNLNGKWGTLAKFCLMDLIHSHKTWDALKFDLLWERYFLINYISFPEFGCQFLKGQTSAKWTISVYSKNTFVSNIDPKTLLFKFTLVKL